MGTAQCCGFRSNEADEDDVSLRKTREGVRPPPLESKTTEIVIEDQQGGHGDLNARKPPPGRDDLDRWQPPSGQTFKVTPSLSNSNVCIRAKMNIPFSRVCTLFGSSCKADRWDLTRIAEHMVENKVLLQKYDLNDGFGGVASNLVRTDWVWNEGAWRCTVRYDAQLPESARELAKSFSDFPDDGVLKITEEWELIRDTKDQWIAVITTTCTPMLVVSKRFVILRRVSSGDRSELEYRLHIQANPTNTTSLYYIPYKVMASGAAHAARKRRACQMDDFHRLILNKMTVCTENGTLRLDDSHGRTGGVDVMKLSDEDRRTLSELFQKV